MYKQKHKQTNFIYHILTLQNNYLDRLSRKELKRLVLNTVTHAKILLFWAQKYFLRPIREKHLNESWNSFVKSSIPEGLSPVL